MVLDPCFAQQVKSPAPQTRKLWARSTLLINILTLGLQTSMPPDPHLVVGGCHQ